MQNKPSLRLKSWELSEELWRRAEPLIPLPQRDADKKFVRDPGAGRKPLPYRTVFAGILYVLRTGIQWKALPKREYGSPSSIHRYFLAWQKAGFFQRLWQAGLAEYDEMEGIAWKWQSIDGSMCKAPLATECVGPNPTDRGKKRKQEKHSGGRQWNPAVPCRQRGKYA